jgi:hypothetical protein
MVMMRTRGNTIALSSGQENREQRFGPEKYAKFVYSSRYAFSVEHDHRSFYGAALDGMIGFSDDSEHFRVRESNEDARIAGETLYAEWRPWPDVVVETWLYPTPPWHVRVHRIVSPRPLYAIEGGFAVVDDEAVDADIGPGRIVARVSTDVSAIVDLSPTGTRRGRAHEAAPNANLIASKSIVPQLFGKIGSGATILICAVMAVPAGAEEVVALNAVPDAPDLDDLEALFSHNGSLVTVFDANSRL